MTREEAMNDDFQVPNGFLPSDKKQSTMTHNTQGGIARWVKAEDGSFPEKPGDYYCKVNVGDRGEILRGCREWTGQMFLLDIYYEEVIEWLNESPLPASPEGTWETEFEKLYAKKNYYNLVSFVQSIFHPLQQENERLKENNKTLAFQKSVQRNNSNHWESKYNEKVKECHDLNEEINEYSRNLKNASELGGKYLQENINLQSQLAEAREALEWIKNETMRPVYDFSVSELEETIQSVHKEASSALK